MRYPTDVYSLSHIALPFAARRSAVRQSAVRTPGSCSSGAIAVRGERNTLVVSQDSLSRLSYNPFHAYMLSRIAEDLDGP